LSKTPIKKSKKKKLTKAQKKYNRELNRLRIRHKRFGLRSNLIAGIYNYELAL